MDTMNAKLSDIPTGKTIVMDCCGSRYETVAETIGHRCLVKQTVDTSHLAPGPAVQKGRETMAEHVHDYSEAVKDTDGTVLFYRCSCGAVRPA